MTMQEGSVCGYKKVFQEADHLVRNWLTDCMDTGYKKELTEHVNKCAECAEYFDARGDMLLAEDPKIEGLAEKRSRIEFFALIEGYDIGFIPECLIDYVWKKTDARDVRDLENVFLFPVRHPAFDKKRGYGWI